MGSQEKECRKRRRYKLVMVQKLRNAVIITIKRYWLVLALLLFFFTNYITQVEDVVAYEDVISSALNHEIRFPFDEITGFAIRDNNEANKAVYETDPISFTICLSYEDELIWDGTYEDVWLQTSYFTEIVDDVLLAAQLKTGETYQVDCYSTDVDLSDVSVRFYGEKRDFSNIYLAICIVSAVVLAGAITAIDRMGKIRMSRIAAGLLLGLAIVWNMVTPPIAVTDEEYHLGHAWIISDRILGINEEVPMVPGDLNYVRYCHVKQTLYSFYDHLFDRNYNDEHMRFDGQLEGMHVPWYAHLAPAVGITIGRILNLNYEWIMILGRMTSLLLAISIIALAFRLLPFGEEGVLAVTLFPMSINLLGSLSYDSLNLALAILFFSMCMNCIYKKGAMTWKDILILTLVAGIFIPIKIIYLPMIFLCALIPISKYGSKLKWAIGNSIICIGSCLILFIQRASEVITVLAADADMQNSVAAQDITPFGYTMEWVIKNPMETVKIFIRSIYEYGDSYVLTAVGSRFNDVTISTVLIFCLLLFFLLLSLGGARKTVNNIVTQFVTGGIGISVVILAMASMFFAFIDFGADVITGVQGRYMLPVFLLFPFMNKWNVIRVGKTVQDTIIKLLVMVDIMVFIEIFTQTLRM